MYNQPIGFNNGPNFVGQNPSFNNSNLPNAYYQPNQWNNFTNPPYYAQPPFRPVDTHLAMSFLNLFFCCFWLGIPAIICSCQAQEQFQRGDLNSGYRSANCARQLNIAGCTIGAVAFVIFIIIITTGALYY